MDQIGRQLLEMITEQGEMPAQDLLRHVPRVRNNHIDFYIAANLMHAGYFDLDAGNDDPNKPFGKNSQETAIQFCQLMLPEGQSFEIHGCLRESWARMDVKAFSTAKGFLKLERLRGQESEQAREGSSARIGYSVAIGVALLAALVSGWAASYFSG